MVFPAVVSHAVVQTVSQHPSVLAHVEIDGQSREREVGYGVACRYRGEDAAGTVGEERRQVGGEEVLVDVAHADKQVGLLPFVHIAQHGKGRQHIVLFDVGVALPVVNDSFPGPCHMERRSLQRPLALP